MKETMVMSLALLSASRALASVPPVEVLSSPIHSTPVYEMRFELRQNGQLISSPGITSMANETARIFQVSGDKTESFDIRVKPSDVGGSIQMELAVDYMKNGREISTQPRILIRDGGSESLPLHANRASGAASDTDEVFELKVSAKRLKDLLP